MCVTWRTGRCARCGSHSPLRVLRDGCQHDGLDLLQCPSHGPMEPSLHAKSAPPLWPRPQMGVLHRGGRTVRLRRVRSRNETHKLPVNFCKRQCRGIRWRGEQLGSEYNYHNPKSYSITEQFGQITNLFPSELLQKLSPPAIEVKEI